MGFFKKISFYISLGVFLLLGIASTNTTEYFEISKNLEIFTSMYKELNTYYVDDIDPNEFIQKGMDAMLKSLDPYTSFYSEAEIENYRFETTGKYGGIGALIKKDEDYIVISEPYKNFPADKAGLLAGDKILSVDGNHLKGKSTEEVSSYLKGEPGTKISVEVLRPQIDGSDKKMDIDITREEVKVSPVPYYGMIEDNIAYIKLSSFTQMSGKEVEKAFKELQKENSNLKGIILDLRGNPGGLLHESVNISNIFIDKGNLVVSTKSKVSDWDKDFKTLNEALDTKTPLVVLTNRSSASASEIVSGAIQDLDRGVIIGQKTFGKGLVQTTRKLTYNTQLKVTTAKYYIPSGRCIQAINYAEKDEDGAVTRIPDSLKVAFKTKNGRTVYDGGGVDPDVEVKPKYLSDISISLVRKDHIFNFATIYKASNKELRDGINFKMSDSEYNDFVSWLKNKDYDYKTESETLLEKLKETAKEEKYFDAISEEYTELKDKIGHDKKKDLQKQKDEIKGLLESEIVLRYFYREGAIRNKLNSDDDIKQALSLFNSPKEYNAVLQGN